MELAEGLEKILQSFQKYYNVTKESSIPLFAAEAEFHSHESQYFLVRSATLSEAESNEYVYFATAEVLDEELLERFDEAAWNAGIKRVIPHADHRNSDITLVILCERMEAGVSKKIRGKKHYKSYHFTLRGWSHYRLIAIELSSGQAACNRQGQSLKKLVSNIMK